jgi:hypothetical protein
MYGLHVFWKELLVESLMGNCILPSEGLETTETITKLIPAQELSSGSFILTTGNG